MRPGACWSSCFGGAARCLVRSKALQQTYKDYKKENVTFITIYKQEYPDELKQAAEDLKKVEFNYEEAKKLQLIGRDGNSKDAEYNCITRTTSCKRSRSWQIGEPAWPRDGRQKYIKVSVRAVVHWFSLRMRACRIFRHRHPGSLPNWGEDCLSESQDLSESEVENLQKTPWLGTCPATS